MPLFNDEQARQIRDYMPVLSNRPPGIDLVEILETVLFTPFEAVQADLAAMVSDTAVVLSGNASITVSDARLAGLGGSPAVATLGEADGAVSVLHCTWSGDDLVITLTAVTTADRDVHWFVDGR